MGIFGALTTAVTGLRSQSFALENLSGNIANSQTTAFKRVDTSFLDLIPDGSTWQQLSGNVLAQSRMTNTVQGDIQGVSVGTFMAINGDGFFVVGKPAGMQDGNPSFDGVERYSRRGDFQPDKNGYLVNGAGYYLMGIPVDSETGNLTGSVPQVLRFQNDFLPAQASSQIDYRVNLASYPFTAAYDKSIPRSELLNPASFISNPLAISPTPAKMTGIGATLLPDAKAVGTGTVGSLTGATTLASLGLAVGDTITVNDGTNTDTITVGAGDTVQTVLDAINGGTAAVTASIDSAGKLVLTSDNFADTITVGGTGKEEIGFAGGADTFKPVNLLTQNAVLQGQTLTLELTGDPLQTITFGTGPGQVSTLAQLKTALEGLTGVDATVDVANGNISIAALSLDDDITIGGTATALTFGLQTTTAIHSRQEVIASDEAAFLKQSIGGGAVTAYDSSGAAVNIQLRWVKSDSSLYGGTDTWNLFYQVDSGATGTEAAWKNAGVNYQFGANGQMDPPVTTTMLSDVTINGVSLGDIRIDHGPGGLTQFADSNGNVQVNQLQQNGYPAGSLQAVSVNDKGRIVGSYSNGRTLELAEVTLANFSGANFLKRIDGGAFEATDQSGAATYGATGRIMGSALEGSNTDIADEFTKLIVTQQAYSANTRVITTANQMVQDMLNMLR